MIIFGSGGVCIFTEKSKTSTCPNCKAIGSLTLKIHSNHTHFYWIPLFPIGKSGEAICEKCLRVFKENQFPADLNKGYSLIKKTLKSKTWQYSGSLIGIIVIGAILNVFRTEDDKKQQILANPMIGDIYQITKFQGFSIMKAKDVTNDSVFVVYNKLRTSHKSKLAAIDKEENYDTIVYPNSYQNIQDRFENGDIIDVIRNY